MTREETTQILGGDDTIAALATAVGRGAIAVVRVSGKHAFQIAQRLGAPPDVVVRAAMRCALRHPATNEALDDALVTHFAGPNSFTGEDVVEFSTHGGRVVPATVLAACLTAGARQALPGEFTRRALLNGRIDLLQAEAIADLVDARTRAMQRQALAQLDGGLSRRLLALRREIIGLEVLLAYDIDFPEEDDGPIAPVRIMNAHAAVRAQLEALLTTAPRAALVRDGALVVIAGPPNAGKSSLFNALLGEARALVTEIPGTTRDAIEALLDTPGMPLRLVDTAGLRATQDVVERLGIEVSERYLGHAQLVLVCADSVEGLLQTMTRIAPHANAPMVAVLTKADRLRASVPLVPPVPAPGGGSGVTDIISDARREFLWSVRDLRVASVTAHDPSSLPVVSMPLSATPFVAASAETGEGLADVLTAIALRLHGYEDGATVDDTPLTRERHRVAIATALEEIVLFENAWVVDGVPATIAAVHLRAAAGVLDELVGSISVDDVLDKLFRDFCVGK